MKKQWTSPRILVQAFEANEYVAVCWKVGCKNDTTFSNRHSNAPFGNLWSKGEGPYDDVFNHNGDCRIADNNYFNANGTNITFVEENTSAQPGLTGGFDHWEDVNSNGIVDTDDVIYWYTDNGYRRWNHWGYVETVDQGHINRS